MASGESPAGIPLGVEIPLDLADGFDDAHGDRYMTLRYDFLPASVRDDGQGSLRVDAKTGAALLELPTAPGGRPGPPARFGGMLEQSRDACDVLAVFDGSRLTIAPVLAGLKNLRPGAAGRAFAEASFDDGERQGRAEAGEDDEREDEEEVEEDDFGDDLEDALLAELSAESAAGGEGDGDGEEDPWGEPTARDGGGGGEMGGGRTPHAPLPTHAPVQISSPSPAPNASSSRLSAAASASPGRAAKPLDRASALAAWHGRRATGIAAVAAPPRASDLESSMADELEEALMAGDADGVPPSGSRTGEDSTAAHAEAGGGRGGYGNGALAEARAEAPQTGHRPAHPPLRDQDAGHLSHAALAHAAPTPQFAQPPAPAPLPVAQPPAPAPPPVAQPPAPARAANRLPPQSLEGMNDLDREFFASMEDDDDDDEEEEDEDEEEEI